MTDTFRPAAVELRMFDMTARFYNEEQQRIRDMCDMLRTFHEAVPGTLDVFYILKGGTSFHEEFEEAFGNRYSSSFYDPRHNTFPSTFSLGEGDSELVCVGNPDPRNIALLVDDSWKSGRTVHRAVQQLEERGYDRSRQWAFHFFGNGGDQQKKDKELGFVRGNPVLVPVNTLFAYFKDRNPSFMHARTWYPASRTTLGNPSS